MKKRVVKDEFDLTLSGHPPFKPRNKPQSQYLEALKRHPMVVSHGPAGSGKTYIPSAHAIEKLATGQLRKIFITRPTVPVEFEEIGFLPGDLNRKMEPWTAPLFDVFRERVGQEKLIGLLKSKEIEIVPFAFMRGRTFKDAFVLVDEAQNMTMGQAKMLVTRIGENCTYSINGDLEQCDLDEGINGLVWIISMIEAAKLPVPVIEFDESHVVRSAECKMWVKAISEYEIEFNDDESSGKQIGFIHR